MGSRRWFKRVIGLDTCRRRHLVGETLKGGSAVVNCQENDHAVNYLSFIGSKDAE